MSGYSSPTLVRVHAPVAQRIEHLTTDQKVRGSNPLGRASSFTHETASITPSYLGSTPPADSHFDSPPSATKNSRAQKRDSDVQILSVTTTRQPQQSLSSGDELLLAQKAEKNNGKQPTSSDDDSTNCRPDESLILNSSTSDCQPSTNDNHDRKEQKNHSDRDRAVHQEQGTSKPTSMSKKSRSKNGVIKRADGRYQKCVELGKKPNGKRNRKYFYGSSVRDVLAQVDQFKANQRLGMVNFDNQDTLNNFAKRWLETTAKANCKPNTVSGYQNQLARYILPIIGNKKLAEVWPSDIEAVLVNALNNNLSVGTQRSIRRTMSSMFSAAERDMRIPFNPVKRTKIPQRDPSKATRKPKPLTKDEAHQLIDLLKENDVYSTIYYLMLFTGLRRGEALGIKWSDINQTDTGYIIDITRQVQEERIVGNDGVAVVEIAINTPKTMNSVRLVPLEDHVVSKLNSMIIGNLLSHSRFGADEFIFVSQNNTPIWPSNVTTNWKKFLKQKGMRHMQLHGLRHTFATLTLESGAPLESVTETLGHSSYAITKDMYASRVTGSAKRATAGITELLSPSITANGGRGVRSQ
jgi:integrase